jgi:hypothetical protein
MTQRFRTSPRGGSSIVGPLGEVRAGPVLDQEALLIADLDMAPIPRARYDFDPIGHYARPGIFRLFDRHVPPLPEVPGPLGHRP